MKTIKSFLVIAIITICFLASNVSAQTVYVTESGKKYHAKNCNIVKTGKKGMEVSEAKKKGYTPCASCKAEAIKPEDKKENTKKTTTTNGKK